jgi:4-amino-4-deoxy-L-arabinose transferase
MLVRTWLVLGLVLVASHFLRLRNLDHSALTRWDEVFHAGVAQNVLKHPLMPTLVDVPYLPYRRTVWNENHVWLHKPVLPFWQVAFSFAVLGVNTLALRLPSALLSTVSAWLTYLIGKELLDRRAAFIAAVLQAANPFLVSLVHGYQFADLVDVALLFWVEVAVWFLTRALRSGSWRDVVLAGVAHGLAFLCKSYLAAIVFGIAVTALILPVCGLGRRKDCRFSPIQLLGLLGATLLTIGPWLLCCMSRFPEEFRHEEIQIWKHLGSNVENWAAPWDRIAFDYLIAIYGVFYTPILVAGIALVPTAFARTRSGLWLVYAWGLGVLLPHLVATTKTPSATLIAMPALLLLLGYLFSQAWQSAEGPGNLDSRGTGEFPLVFTFQLAALTAVLTLGVLFPAIIKNPGHGYPSPRVSGGVMFRSLWVVGHVAGALAVAAVVSIATILLRRRLAVSEGSVGRFVRLNAIGYCLCALIWLLFSTVGAAWRVTEINANDPSYVIVGRFARDHLPENAVLLVEESKGHEHLTMMFYADRTCYVAPSRGPDEMARRIARAGGIPYLVSHRELPHFPVYRNETNGPTVYLWQPH